MLLKLKLWAAAVPAVALLMAATVAVSAATSDGIVAVADDEARAVRGGQSSDCDWYYADVSFCGYGTCPGSEEEECPSLVYMDYDPINGDRYLSNVVEKLGFCVVCGSYYCSDFVWWTSFKPCFRVIGP